MTTASSEARKALDKAIGDALPRAGGRVLSLLESLQAELIKTDKLRARELRWGDLVRLRSTATGRYLGEFEGRKLALYVSAMDNSVNIGEIDEDAEPWQESPAPTPRELEAACNGIRYGMQLAGGAS